MPFGDEPLIFIKDTLDSQLLGVLATQEGDRPYLSLLAFAYSDDLRFLFFATLRNTRKFAICNNTPRLQCL